MFQCWKPMLLLVALCSILPEVVSGATPVVDFLSPAVLLLYVVFLYGVPVLVVRELAVRHGLGPMGLWCLGVVYGLYNEGLRSQDLFHPYGHTGDGFAAYGVVGHVLIPFTIFICFWHGLFSVLIPVLLVDFVYPQHASRPWLPSWLTWVFAILSVGTAALAFFGVGTDSPAGSVTTRAVHFAIMIVVGVVSWFGAGLMPRTRLVRAPGGGVRPFVTGWVLFAATSALPFALAELRVPWPVVVAYFAALVAVGYRATRRAPQASRATAAVLGLGAVTAHGLTTVGFAAADSGLLLMGSGFAVAAVSTVVAVLVTARSRRTS